MNTDDLNEFVSAVAIPLLHVGPDQRIAAANGDALSILGTGIVGRYYVSALRHPGLLGAIEGALSGGEPQDARVHVTKRGTESEFQIRAVPVAGAGGVLVSFVDVTDLEEAGQMRRDFVANVSHELRTPLTAMAGFIETLRGAARDDPVARERFLEIMSHEADRMNRLVQDLLSLSRVEAEERVRPTQAVNIVDTMRSAAAQLDNQARAEGVRIEEDFVAQDVTVQGDPDQLTQVFLNLIENAVRYGGAGGRITLKVDRIDYEPVLRCRALRASVTDYGQGVDPDDLPRLTERFYRVDDHRSRAIGGTGLGLAIVKHIVNRHRGRLRINSERGRGSTFAIVLPQA